MFLRPVLAGQQMMAMGLKREVLWMALVLVALLSAIQMSVTFQFAEFHIPPDLSAEERALMEFVISIASRPFILTMLIAGSLIISVFFLHWVGRMIGGQGTLSEVLAVVTLWQLVSFVAGLGIFLLSIFMLPVASLVNMVLNIWLLYSLSGLLAAAHRFKTPLAGLATVVLTIFAVAFGLLVAFIILGVGSGIGATNV
ncbi:YIP1 family protein [Lentibacter algarum]|uniref:Yip1 family protein n=1 Tax=Lentibacter algarum TaxID=576131 RepID=UPI001C07E875|nr:Yip1 family protein [Lentibacter algarum]MBU2982322.1 YIP1 family protein [Lentibacter algarum]